MRVKICGITRKEDALLVAGLGADAIGIVNVRESKRFTSLEKAKEIFHSVPPFVSRVIVIAPANLDEVRRVEETGADHIQLHGEESPEFVKEIRENSGLKIIKQIPVVDENSIEAARIYSSLVDAILLDTKVRDTMGGTGKTHDWSISRKIVESVDKPVILAGGLNPDNVAEAIKGIGPYAVDIASGVEAELGIKDPEKVRRFIQNATQ
ncbi:MAG: phosphoribosylanthranilate isomerase [Candidatus Altiarchaeales archaeon]|nr:phosphoribosylanthranilate isomerase [Candidatus Altiarchaeota archaeon]MCG2782579.1 phosphoribosylanthranilate isomerase [Candidatus Altiarchaeales archaeon]MBU4265892.1 phosphoribosylanthranilate isomerase [Candidatus Altiarchaeota archaeon]MBU4341671.1 phosphoribosylanthranilate isomerase [Candidatus Altiarchaeota archaeon]MBU4406518.1 phosphoribosylanthranilate isomerase [Candidatus Altiarchaeota archaeon]